MARFFALCPASSALESICNVRGHLKQFWLLFRLLSGSTVCAFGQPPSFAMATSEFGT
jgi:hypothetical protein